MSTIKTLVNDSSVEAFIDTVEDDTRKQDAFRLLEMYTRLTGEGAKMWGTGIIGFGKFHYKSERSRQEGDWPLSAFSPRKQNLTLYFEPGFDGVRDQLDKLGKHKTSVGCLYINKLADIDIAVLEQLISNSHREVKEKYKAVDAN